MPQNFKVNDRAITANTNRRLTCVGNYYVVYPSIGQSPRRQQVTKSSLPISFHFRTLFTTRISLPSSIDFVFGVKYLLNVQDLYSFEEKNSH